MSTFIILFFISLIGIVSMLSFQVIRLRKGQVFVRNDVDHLLEVSEFGQEVKEKSIKTFKKYGHIFLVILITLIIRMIFLIKRVLKKLYIKIKKYISSKIPASKPKNIAASKFMKSMHEYKARINKIKEKIKEEERQELEALEK